MTSAQQTVLDTVNAIQPFDNVEQVQKDDVLAWINSGAPLFRIAKPDNPPKHLVSYFVLYDAQNAKVLVVDHVNAGLWLPPGGHVDIDEDPHKTVVREADEELRVNATFNTVFGENPVFLSVMQTRGSGTHTDVNLWYVINGDSNASLAYDSREMNGYKWLSLQDVLNTDISGLDPHMHRFVQKMQHTLATSPAATAAQPGLQPKPELQVSDAEAKALLLINNLQASQQPKTKSPVKLKLLIAVAGLIIFVVIASMLVGAFKTKGSSLTSGSSGLGLPTQTNPSKGSDVTNQVNQDVKACSNPLNGITSC
jgi:8-oxo-dGTP pyrophosphatase MutT (NUDIX family)